MSNSIGIDQLLQKIEQASSFVLTTHKSSDADGLGSILAFQRALLFQNKSVVSLTPDAIAPRYQFMNHESHIRAFEKESDVPNSDLAIIFDTNDYKIVNPLYAELKKKCKEIIFIDHHLRQPDASPEDFFFISQDASSAGELCFLLIEKMGIKITKEIARAIYISIIFDTSMFRSVKDLSKTFYICHKIFSQIEVNNIYDKLFCNYSEQEWNSALDILNKVEYRLDQKIAIIQMNYQKFKQNNLDTFLYLDILDFVMRRSSVKVAVLCLERQPQKFKFSLRSKEGINVSEVAQQHGGGGHMHSAGIMDTDVSIDKVVHSIEQQITKSES